MRLRCCAGLFFAVVGAVYVPYGLRELDFSSLGLGLTLACAGIGGLLGGLVGSGLLGSVSGRSGSAGAAATPSRRPGCWTRAGSPCSR